MHSFCPPGPETPSSTNSRARAKANIMSTNANAEFDKQNTDTDDIPQGGDTVDNSYATSDRKVPVVKDEVPVEQPNDARNPDSDKALGMTANFRAWTHC
jgi:hypothetical protein